MALETLPSSAREIAETTEQEAIDSVAKREGLVTDIRAEHKEIVRQTLMQQVEDNEFGVVGSDGAELADALPPSQEELDSEVEEMSDEREKHFRDGVKVANLPGNVVGEERDGDRSVRIDATLMSADVDAAQQEEVDNHEFRHTRQETADDSAPAAPDTGDRDIDEAMQLGTTQLREWDAMRFAGDRFTSSQYHSDYKEPVNRAIAYLNENGENGEQLAEKAALEGQIGAFRQAILRAHLQREMGGQQAN